jgi:hypothetical protein
VDVVMDKMLGIVSLLTPLPAVQFAAVSTYVDIGDGQNTVSRPHRISYQLHQYKRCFF